MGWTGGNGGFGDQIALEKERLMSDTDVKPVTLDDLAARMDLLGNQMNWLCENLASLFGFVNQMSQNGGGIRGMMKALKQQEAVVMTEAPSE